jgi:hypothetical protein
MEETKERTFSDVVMEVHLQKINIKTLELTILNKKTEDKYTCLINLSFVQFVLGTLIEIKSIDVFYDFLCEKFERYDYSFNIPEKTIMVVYDNPSTQQILFTLNLVHIRPPIITVDQSFKKEMRTQIKNLEDKLQEINIKLDILLNK